MTGLHTEPFEIETNDR